MGPGCSRQTLKDPSSMAVDWKLLSLEISILRRKCPPYTHARAHGYTHTHNTTAAYIFGTNREGKMTEKEPMERESWNSHAVLP